VGAICYNGVRGVSSVTAIQLINISDQHHILFLNVFLVLLDNACGQKILTPKTQDGEIYDVRRLKPKLLKCHVYSYVVK
jgi:hypothetical protein